MKYLIAILLAYLAYRVIRPLLTSRSTGRTGGKKEGSLEIPEEDIRDAEFKDVNGE
ncbi:MAG: hypothetical protein ACE5LH_05595 [Fidelibacterota bacterium]